MVESEIFVAGKIKWACETKLDIVSQCCQPGKLKYIMQDAKQHQMFIHAFPLNKLSLTFLVGGRNTELFDRPPLVNDECIIIFGADVTHPTSDSTPSVAAVVAAMDCPYFMQYRAILSSQSPRQEIIDKLCVEKKDETGASVPGGIIRDLLEEFFRLNGQKKPDKIIFYRDGVGESQFQQVVLQEIDAIRHVHLSWTLTLKLHLWWCKRGTTHGSFRQTPSFPTRVEILWQGTSRPAHYHVLYDENNFRHARCTKAVSLVPPVHYAHLAAYRARQYLKYGESGESSSSNAVRPLPSVKENVKRSMFYG